MMHEQQFTFNSMNQLLELFCPFISEQITAKHVAFEQTLATFQYNYPYCLIDLQTPGIAMAVVFRLTVLLIDW